MKSIILTALCATAAVFAQTTIDELVPITVNGMFQQQVLLLTSLLTPPGIAYTVDVPIAIPTPTATIQYLTTVAVALQLNYYIPTTTLNTGSLNAVSVLQSAVCGFSDARYCGPGMATSAPSVISTSLTTITVTARISGSQVLSVAPYLPEVIATTTVLVAPPFISSSTISTILSTSAVVVVVAPSASPLQTITSIFTSVVPLVIASTTIPLASLSTTVVPLVIATTTIPLASLSTATLPLVVVTSIATTTISSIVATPILSPSSSLLVVVTTTLLTSSTQAVTTVTATRVVGTSASLTTIAIAATTAAPPVLTSHAFAAPTNIPAVLGGLAAGLVACLAL